MKEERTQFWYLNGNPISGDPNLVLPTVLESIPDLQYWSAEALQKLYIGALELAIIMAKEEKKCKKGSAASKLTRFINSVPNRLKLLPRDRNRLIELAYSAILSSEGLSTLTGFGMGNKFGDYIAKNPELQTIRK